MIFGISNRFHSDHETWKRLEGFSFVAREEDGLKDEVK
jgi:hypothetical protein